MIHIGDKTPEEILLGNIKFDEAYYMGHKVYPESAPPVHSGDFLLNFTVPEFSSGMVFIVVAGANESPAFESLLLDGVTVHTFNTGITYNNGLEVSIHMDPGDHTIYGKIINGRIPTNCLDSVPVYSVLNSVEIPANVTSIGNYAFSGIRNTSGVIPNIYCYAMTPPTIERNSFGQTNNCPIYVPASVVDMYKTSWSQYADRIQAMS